MRFGKIGAKQMMYHWKNPYVTDGLVAWWDGILSNKSNKWENLIRQSPIEDFSAPLLVGTLDVIPTGYRMTQATYANAFTASHNLSGLNGLTIEVVTSGMTSTNTFWPSFGFNADTSAYLRAFWRSDRYIANPETADGYKTFGSGSLIGINCFGGVWDGDSGVGKAINNGGSIYQFSFTPKTLNPPKNYKFYLMRYFVSGATAGSGDIYCCRVYSRALTADEIAANYAVDKARFGLP